MYGQLLGKLEGEYDAFERKAELADCCDGAKPATFTSSDLYDAIGSAHDAPVTRRSSTAENPRKQLLDVINEIMHDTSCVITREQLFALHQCLLPASSGQAGVLRTDLAVGYASPRIYRVFIPAGEIDDALDNLIETLNDSSRWENRPLLRAYYAFAVLVFFIHPFHDGNGRCARLLGNLVAKKLGFPITARGRQDHPSTRIPAESHRDHGDHPQQPPPDAPDAHALHAQRELVHVVLI